MTVEQARQFAASLIKAADQAEAEGRTTMNEADLQVFAAADDAAREALAAAIAAARGT